MALRAFYVVGADDSRIEVDKSNDTTFKVRLRRVWDEPTKCK